MDQFSTVNDTDALAAWVAKQALRSANAMERAISATALVRRRDAFGQVVVPTAGSVLASPVFADWDPEPDYFFHWVRDSAIVMRSVAELMQDSASAAERRRWRRHFEDFVRFSLALCSLDGAGFASASRHRAATRRDFRRFLRSDSELRGLAGDSLLGEPRFNPDGTLDFQRWSRPHHHRPALRPLACLRSLAAGRVAREALQRLLPVDPAFTLRHPGLPRIAP